MIGQLWLTVNLWMISKTVLIFPINFLFFSFLAPSFSSLLLSLIMPGLFWVVTASGDIIKNSYHFFITFQIRPPGQQLRDNRLGHVTLGHGCGQIVAWGWIWYTTGYQCDKVRAARLVTQRHGCWFTEGITSTAIIVRVLHIVCL